MIPAPYKVWGSIRGIMYMWGDHAYMLGHHMIPVPYNVRENHQIPIPYKVWGTIRVIDIILCMWEDYMIPIPYKVLGTIRVT